MKLKLYLYLKENKITQLNFSKTIGCTPEHFNKIISGKVRASKMLAFSIEKATEKQITMQYLLEEES